MTTAEFMLCEIIGCGEYDIKYLFDKMDDDILSNAIKSCESEMGKLDCGGIWQLAIENSLALAFENEGNEIDWDDFEIRFNFIDSDVYMNKEDATKYQNFESACDNFYALTGFEIQVE